VTLRTFLPLPMALAAAMTTIAATAPVPAPRLQPAERVDTATLARIRDEGLHRSQVMDTAFWLSDRYGPRLDGSPEMAEAGAWAMTRLREWGLANVHEEPFPARRGWSLASFHATMTSPRVMPIIGVPRAWTPGTNGPVTARVVRPVIHTAADAERYRGTLRGAIVLTQPARAVRMLEHGDGLVIRYDDQNGKWAREAMTPEAPVPAPATPPPATVPAAPASSPRPAARPFNLLQFYKDEGVVALIDRGPNGDLADGGSNLSWRVQRTDGGTVVAEDGTDVDDPAGTLPQIVIAVEQYNRMVRLLDHDVPIEMELEVGVRWSDAARARSFNIVGDIPGRDKADEVVMLGAHFDSWQGATGATDNAAGVSAMMEAMRIIRTLGLQPRRTIRLALWGGEEEGLFGSAAYAATHLGTMTHPTPDLARTTAYFNLDNGTGRIRGIWTQGRTAVQPIFAAWMAPLADLGVTMVSPRAVEQTDHVTFDALGIPAFQFIQERYEYNSRTHHTNMDVYDRLQPDDLKQMAVVAAVFAWQAATRDEPLPRTTAPSMGGH
jgi:hypothetical protein